MKRLVIFDLDGTLVNSVADLGAACNHALRLMGYPEHTKAAYRIMVGNGISKLIERALPEDSRRAEIIDEMRKHFIDYYNDHLWDETRPYDGISELLSQLADRDIKLAVASNKYQEATTRIVEHFFSHVPWASVIGQRPDIPLKPDPSVVFSVLLQTPTPKAEVLYVGDSAVDMETAYRACVDCVGVTWGFRTLAELTKRADYIANTPAEILNFLDNPK